MKECCSSQSRREEYQEEPHEEERQAWEFSRSYTIDELIQATKTRENFFREFISWEAKFFTGPGVHPSGLTRDGVGPAPDGHPRDWSAPSKEALHLSVLAMRLLIKGDPLCDSLMSSRDAIAMLTKKISTYERISAKRPYLHGFLPWINSATGDPADMSRAEIRLPCLDNGQFVWGLYGAMHALNESGERVLAEQYKSYLTRMASNVVQMAYRGNGVVAQTMVVRPPQKSGGKAAYEMEGEDCDPWESELFSIFVDLLGDFKAAGYADDDKERDAIWSHPARHRRIRRAQLELGEGGPGFAVCAGWHFSSHELWKYLSLPYRCVDCTRKMLVNGERARTHALSMLRVPGLVGSCNRPDGTYCDTVGISECISDLERTNTEWLSPYGAFPTLLAHQVVGTVWLKTMLDVRGMQTELGCAESFRSDGSEVCGIRTWDVKVTLVVALLGGGDYLKLYLEKDGFWPRFEQIVCQLYSKKFCEPMPGSDLPLALPSASLLEKPTISSGCTSQ